MIRQINYILSVTIAFTLISTCIALYEDQIKKFDWTSLQIGELQYSHLELNYFEPRLLVSTKENVIASLSPKTGEILWRQIFETGARGHIKLLHVSSGNIENSGTAAARLNSKHAFDMLTVQGHAPALIRGWNPNTGAIEWEWSLMPLQADLAQNAFWFYSNSILYHVMPSWKSHLEVTQYFATTGQANGQTSRISTPWINAKNCVRNGIYYTCLEGNQLLTLDLTASHPQVHAKSILTSSTSKLSAVEGVSGVLVVDKTFVSIVDDIKVCTNLDVISYTIGSYNDKKVVALANLVSNQLNIKVYYIDNCEQVEELTQIVSYPEHFGVPAINNFDCRIKRGNDGKGCLFLLSTEDESMVAIQQSKIRWAREESLANVVAADFIDLPLADAEGTLENEIKQKRDADIYSAFSQRIATQLFQIKSIFLHVIGLGQPPTDTQKAGLVRDSFGLHKMLVILTKSGKIFGIDNVSGKHHWAQYLSGVENFATNENMQLIVQRTSKHFPLQPICAVVAKDKLTGNGVLFRFNPINGKPVESGLVKLTYPIKQLVLLAKTEQDFIRGLLLLDVNNKIEVYPERAKEKAIGLHVFVAEKKTAILEGFYVTHYNDNLELLKLWNSTLAGFNNEHEIIAIATKNPHEKVHSQGRVLGDRSVLYKYVNPNLVAVITQAKDEVHKYIMNLHLIDAVSGVIIFSMNHRKTRAPINIVHSENWLAYTYYNDKFRRTEITTIEMYEGKTQSNNSVWSSWNAPQIPMVERQSYIIPAVVTAMRETITERGITSKHVLMGTASGAVVEMPWILLDPRRPKASTTQGREEGAIPYAPELPLPTEGIINYNQSIARLNNIYTAPSGLESTCLVLATGLDIFVTRVAPSKTFDLLIDDFDYILISIVLVALTTGSLVVKHLASKKLMKQAWK